MSELNNPEIGRRLRVCRRNANIRQAQAAKRIGKSRATLVAIEQGKRRARITELQELCALYGTSVNGLLRRTAVHVDLVARFRERYG